MYVLLIHDFYYHFFWLVKAPHNVTKIIIEDTQLMVLLTPLHCQQILITNSKCDHTIIFIPFSEDFQ